MPTKLSVFIRFLVPVLIITAIAPPSTAQLTPSTGDTRSAANTRGHSTLSIASTVEPTNTLEVPIRQVSIDLNDGRLQLWIEGDRLGTCNFPLEVTEQPETPQELATVRIRVFHTIPENSDCARDYVPFVIPFNVQQTIEPGRVYEIWVNDYHFTLENRSGNSDPTSIGPTHLCCG